MKAHHWLLFLSFPVLLACGAEWRPLTRGALQIQSEAAEVYFKDIKIRAIDAMAEEVAFYFRSDELSCRPVPLLNLPEVPDRLR